MFFLFGFGTKRQHVGAGSARTCARCHNHTQWGRVKEFRQFTLFFIPVARWSRKELEVCGICAAAVQL